MNDYGLQLQGEVSFLRSLLKGSEAQRDEAIARAGHAEAWIETHFEYLGDMENALCVHGNLHVPVSKVREWFNTLVWFNPITTADREKSK